MLSYIDFLTFCSIFSAVTDPRHRGNMIVTVLVDIPHNLTDRQRELLREFDEIEMAKSRETDATPN